MMRLSHVQRRDTPDTTAAIAMPDAIENVHPAAAMPGTGPHQGRLGTSAGINIEPGSHDDGWTVPRPVTLADGSRVQLYKDGESLHAIYDAIERATHRVCMEFYTVASDDTGRAFAKLLAEKARQGVRVYFIYDSFGSLDSDPELFDEMRRAGAQVEEFHPFYPWRGRFRWHPFNRDHRKLAVIDDRIACLGGLNLAGEYAGSWIVKPPAGSANDPWRDTGITIQGPVAREFLRAFASTWHYVTRRGPIRSMEHIYNLQGVCGESCPWPIVQHHHPRRRGRADTPEGAGQLGILASVPQRNSPLRPFLNRLIRDAKQSISMTMAYFAPHDDLIDELCRAARRGVKVRLMLPGRGDVRLLMIAARSFYETLMTAGVQVFERQGVILHAKTMVIDSLVSMVGSTNLDYRSIEYNLELSALIRSRQFGQQMEDLFQHDVQFARRIWPHHWRHRPVRDRLVQWLVSRARYLL